MGLYETTAMRVLHIATMDHGGAGIAVQRIHKSMLQQGVDSQMLVRFKSSDDDTITAAQPNMGLYQPSSLSVVRKAEQILRRRGRCLTQVERYERQLNVLDRVYGAAYTLPVSNFDLSQHPLVQQADILHLHWVENFLDYQTFFDRINKPIVWTFHDENIAYGGFHYSDEAVRLKEPFAAMEDDFVKIKKDALADGRHNIHMVALSGMMEQFYRQHSLFPSYPVNIIHNGLEPEQFAILDRSFCREALNIPQDKTVISFCATDINDTHKGLKSLLQSLANITNKQNILLLCVGKGTLPTCDFPVIGTGPIANPRLLSIAYSASDLFVLPSFQEAFAQTPLEAMACGCPVVAFPCSGTEELINGQNGIRCANFTTESLSAGINNTLDHSYNRQAIRDDVVKRFNIDRIAKQYIDLYSRCIQ